MNRAITSFVLLTAAALSAQAERPCAFKLTDEDHAVVAASAASAASATRITSDADIESLPPNKKSMLCNTLRITKELMAKPGSERKLTTSKNTSSVYLSGDYYEVFTKALRNYVADMLTERGLSR